MSSFKIDSDNKIYSSDTNGIIFDINKKIVVRYPPGRLERQYTIPEGVIKINDYAFSGVTELTEIMISSSIITIGSYSFKSSG